MGRGDEYSMSTFRKYGIDIVLAGEARYHSYSLLILDLFTFTTFLESSRLELCVVSAPLLQETGGLSVQLLDSGIPANTRLTSFSAFSSYLTPNCRSV